MGTYICGSCGRSFTRASSARRHVNTVEQGSGQVYSEAQYNIGISTGMLVPPIGKMARPTFGKSKSTVTEITRDEFLRGMARRLGELYAEKDPNFANQMMTLLTMNVQHDLLRDLQRSQQNI